MLVLYEIVARSGYFPAVLLPPLSEGRRNPVHASLIDGTMLHHAAATLYRVLFGMVLAIIVAVPLGVLMARFKTGREFLPAAGQRVDADPVAGMGAGLHSLVRSWQYGRDPDRVLCLDISDPAQHLVRRSLGQSAVAACGWRDGAGGQSLFWKVMIPAASPFIITGIRQAFLRAWIAVIGAEFLAASDWGLGWVIFDSKEFLNADLMLASLAVIGFIGFVFERVVFGSVEKATVMRWGMVRAAKT